MSNIPTPRTLEERLSELEVRVSQIEKTSSKKKK
jgi:uncharacterized coiled-coil protein SlyX